MVLFTLSACTSVPKTFVDRKCVNDLNLAAAEKQKLEKVSGKLSKEGVGLLRQQVTAEIQKHLDELKSCYEKSFNPNFTPDGKLTFLFLVAGDGKVDKACVSEASIDDPGFQGCILNRVKAFRFPPPKGNVSVLISYPFNFRTVHN